MVFHVYADYAGDGLIKAIANKYFTRDLTFDRTMIADGTLGEGDRLLCGFADFVSHVALEGAKCVFVFDLLDRVDEARGETVLELMQALFARGVEVHATSLHVESAVVQTVLAAAKHAGYRTIVTKSQTRRGKSCELP